MTVTQKESREKLNISHLDEVETEIVKTMRVMHETEVMEFARYPLGKVLILHVRVDDSDALIPSEALEYLADIDYRLKNTEPVTVDNADLAFYKPERDWEYDHEWMFERDEEWVELQFDMDSSKSRWASGETDDDTDEIEIDDFWDRLDEEELRGRLRHKLKEQLRHQLYCYDEAYNDDEEIDMGDFWYRVDEREVMYEVMKKLKSDMRRQLSTDDPEADE